MLNDAHNNNNKMDMENCQVKRFGSVKEWRTTMYVCMYTYKLYCTKWVSWMNVMLVAFRNRNHLEIDYISSWDLQYPNPKETHSLYACLLAWHSTIAIYITIQRVLKSQSWLRFSTIKNLKKYSVQKKFVLTILYYYW